jgi:hypothetical protein
MQVLLNLELKSRLMVETGRYSDVETMAAVHGAAATGYGDLGRSTHRFGWIKC